MHDRADIGATAVHRGVDRHLFVGTTLGASDACAAQIEHLQIVDLHQLGRARV
jgi:hypothetical protein